MVMISNIVAVTMHGPVEVFLEPMGMPVFRDHLQMILNGFEDCRRMTDGWEYGPNNQTNAEQRCESVLN